MKKSDISKYFSDLAKRSHKKNPRPRSFYVKMGKKGAKRYWEKRREAAKKLSPF